MSNINANNMVLIGAMSAGLNGGNFARITIHDVAVKV